jgi:hypothetical protein
MIVKAPSEKVTAPRRASAREANSMDQFTSLKGRGLVPPLFGRVPIARFQEKHGRAKPARCVSA